MAIHIDRISINRGGPLKDDFNLEPEGLNLIYGCNETGKTYLVEALIELLFRTGKSTPWIKKRTKSRESTIRSWEPQGRIAVSGLEDETTIFTPNGRKLDDFAGSGGGLPEDLSRLMVVRAGDTKLSSAPDGIGDEVLRTYLSNKGILDEIERAIPQESVKRAIISDGLIEPGGKGLLKNRSDVRNKIDNLESLQLKVDDNASLAAIRSLEKQREYFEGQLKTLENAKRHKAFEVSEEIRKLEFDLKELPSEKSLIDLSTETGLYRAEIKELAAVESKLEDALAEEENYSWIHSARDEYLSQPEIQVKRSAIERISPLLLLIFIVLTAAGGFISRTLMITAAAGAIACVLLLLRSRPEPLSESAILRIKELREEFSRRFGRELTDSATLQQECQRMEEWHLKHENLKEKQMRLARDTGEMAESIRSRFQSIIGGMIEEEEWDKTIERSRQGRTSIQEQIFSQRAKLDSLGVPVDSYLPETPEEEWSQKRYLELKDELESVLNALDLEKRSIESLKTEIQIETGFRSAEIRKLLSALEERIEDEKCRYREITAKILAGNAVFSAVEEFRSLENAKLSEALESREVVSPLSLITDHYTGMRMDDEGYLIMRTAEGEEYPLSQLSTGAAEQVYMALRIGLAERSFNEPAFLILDDAFQHSDWNRRKNLVSSVIRLANEGWQIFYFTMDDHLQELFDRSGREFSRRGFTNTSLNL
jgi:uncharacterized protein YhaN